jgi:hypothetical protein
VKEFTDVAALGRFLSWMNENWATERRQALFTEFLTTQFEFTPEQAGAYVSVVLSENSDVTPNAVEQHSRELVGTWVRMKQDALASGWLSNVKYSWTFRDDLTYEFATEKYDGYVSPFGQSMSRNSSTSDRGIWAASDCRGNDGKLALLVISYETGQPRTLGHAWTDREPFYHRSCVIDGDAYARQI